LANSTKFGRSLCLGEERGRAWNPGGTRAFYIVESFFFNLMVTLLAAVLLICVFCEHTHDGAVRERGAGRRVLHVFHLVRIQDVLGMSKVGI
jgi:hypothetical protein